MTEERPIVGLGVMILKDGKILLGKRKGAHGEGEYSIPGGHLEYMESLREGVQREVAEECGIEVANIRFLYLSNSNRYTPKHFVGIGFAANWKSGKPKVLEPDRCESWGWYELDALPEPLYETVSIAIEAYRTGRVYFDFGS